MNMISTIRQRVHASGVATITSEEFNQLQAEWIKRCGLGWIPASIEVSGKCDASGYCCVSPCQCGGDTPGVRSGCHNWVSNKTHCV